MPFGLRLSLVLLIAGCAESALIVPDSDWMIVPTAQRATLDKQFDAELAACRAEFAAASASLAAIPRAQPAAPHPSATPDPVLAADDPWLEVERHRAQQRNEARGRVEATTAEVHRTDLAWRQLRVETAEARLAMVISQRELIRGQAVNRNLRGEDIYDTAPYRGQFSREQRRWYALATRAGTARDAFEHATTDLASYKEAYAQLMRALPMRVAGPDVTEDHDARLALSAWSISRSDIRRRRGLRHFLDDAIATPQLRRQTYLLRPLGRTPTAIAAVPAAAAAAPPAPSETPAPKLAAKPAAPGPADAPTASQPAAPASEIPASRLAAKPAVPAEAATTLASRPAAAPALEHPADRAAASTSPAAVAAKPAAPPTPVAAKPAAPPPSSLAAKPAPSPQIAHPADRAAALPTEISSNARPAGAAARSAPPPGATAATPGRSEAAAAGSSLPVKPAAARPAQSAPTSAAKPVDPDGHVR